jgi:hypothetical protein
MKAQVLYVVLILGNFPAVVCADATSAPGLKQQIDQLMLIVKVLQEDLARTQTELASTRDELTRLKRNTVLGLDGLLVMRQDTEGRDTVIFDGVNVQIVNGTGATDSANGLGNLFLGYNTSHGVSVGRIGSHNVVLGDEQSYENTQEVVAEKLVSNRDLTVSVANNLNTFVGYDQLTSIGNDRTEQIGRNNSENIGNATSIAIGSNADISVGNDMGLSVGQDATFVVSRDAELSAGNTATVDAAEQVLLKSGKASSLLTKTGGITTSGKDITIKGSGEINIKASGDLVLKGAKILQN